MVRSARPATRPPNVLGLVADDLTGATDSSVAFAEAGWRVELLLSQDGPESAALTEPAGVGGEPTVLAISTGCRAASNPAAASLTARAVQTLLRSGIERLYLKIDSTVRGSVAAQIDGALGAWRVAHSDAAVAICPAFPAVGRTVEDGTVLVDGVPVADSPAGHDPITPMRHSHLGAIIPGSIHLATPIGGTARSGAKVSYDARDDADLAQLAAIVDGTGPAAVAVGSGGLAAAIAHRWRRPRSARASPQPAGQPGAVLVAVTSLHPVARQQVLALEQNLETLTAVKVITTEVRRRTTSGEQVAAELASRVVEEFASGQYRAMILVGGDGAAAVLQSLGAHRISITSAILAGIPAGVIVGGPAHGISLVTKSGGFGGPNTLTDIVRHLRAGQSTSRTRAATIGSATVPLADRSTDKDPS